MSDSQRPSFVPSPQPLDLCDLVSCNRKYLVRSCLFDDKWDSNVIMSRRTVIHISVNVSIIRHQDDCA